MNLLSASLYYRTMKSMVLSLICMTLTSPFSNRLFYEISDSQDSEIPTITELDRLVEDSISLCVGTSFSMNKASNTMNDYIALNRPEKQNWSVSIIDLNTGQTIGYSESENQTAASSIKLFVAGAVMEHRDKLLEKYSENQIDQLLRLSLIISDNDSATQLISMLGSGNTTKGKEIVNKYCQEHGFDSTFLGILFSGLDPSGTYNTTSAKDTARFMEEIYHHRLAGSEKILGYLADSERLAKIPSAIPEGIATANKTGELNNTQNDTAIVYARRPFVISILIDEAEYSRAAIDIQELTRLIYPYFE